MKEASVSPESGGANWSITGGAFEPVISPGSAEELAAHEDQTRWIKDEAKKINDLTTHMVRGEGDYADTTVRDRYVAYSIVTLAAQLCNPDIWEHHPELAQQIHRDVAAVAKELDELHEGILETTVRQAVEAGLDEPPISAAVRRIVDIGGFSAGDQLRAGAVIGQLYLKEAAANQPTASDQE